MNLKRSLLYRTITLSVAALTVLTTTPVSISAVAAPVAAVVGSVSSVGSVKLRGVDIAREATLFAGDVVRSSDGYAKLSLKLGHRVELGPQSEVRVDEEGPIVELALTSGSVGFTASGSSPFRVGIDPFEVTATDAGSGLVTISGPNTIGVRATKGSLLIRNTQSLESFVIAPGQERLLGRSNGAVAEPLGQIASRLPAALPAGMPPPRSAVPRQAGSGLSTGQWVSIIAAVGAGSAVAAFFAGRAGGVDEADLNAANAALTSANTNLTAAQSQVASLNSQISNQQSQNTLLNQQIASLNAANQDLQNQIAAQQSAIVEVSAVRSSQTLENYVVVPGFRQPLGTESLGQVASSDPAAGPSGAPGPLPLPAPRQVGSGMSGPEWISILAAVGGGAAVAAFFAGRAGTIDQSELDAANAALANANSNLSSAESQAASLGGQLSTLQNEGNTLGGQRSTLNKENQDLQNQLIGLENAAALESNTVETEQAAAEVASVAEQTKAALAASSISEEAKANLGARADALITKVTQSQQKIQTLNSQIADLKAQIAATNTSALSDGPSVKDIQAPPGAGPATLALYAQLTALEEDLAAERITVNDALSEMQQLLDDAESEGVPAEDIPTLTRNTVGEPVLKPPVENTASASLPV